MTIKQPKPYGYQLRTDEEEASFLPRISGWEAALDEPEKCIQILSRIYQKNAMTRAPKKYKTRAAGAGK